MGLHVCMPKMYAKIIAKHTYLRSSCLTQICTDLIDKKEKNGHVTPDQGH